METNKHVLCTQAYLQPPPLLPQEYAMSRFTFACRFFTVTLALVATPAVSWAQVSANMCGDFAGAQWDYRTATQKQHDEVEGAHFVPKVEQLIDGNRGYLGGDLAYTLRASPNHHRALVSITRWSERLNKSTQLPHMPLPVECYFERGIRYRPDDHVVRLLYAQFLINQARPAEAAKQLEQVALVAGDNGFTLYNIGLVYSDMKDYAQALAYAHKALALGFERPELRKRLEAAGRWTEPVASSAEPAASSAVAPPVPAASADVPKQD